MKRLRPTNLSTNSTTRRHPRSVASAKELGELQALMAGAIMRPLTARNQMQPRSASGRPMTRVAESFIKPNDRLTSFERLEIYNRQYWFRVLDCFYDDYPGLRAVIGDRKFDRLARAYLTRHPSESFTLRNLGCRLEEFLRAEPRWIAPHQRLALDMVRLEWANIVAFDEAAKPVIHVDDLLGRAPSKVRLALQPYITLLEVRYPVDNLLIAAKKGDDRLRGEASNAVELRRLLQTADPRTIRGLARLAPGRDAGEGLRRAGEAPRPHRQGLGNPSAAMVSGMGVLRLVLPTVKNFRRGLAVAFLLALDDADAYSW